jgi:hypothetical protein
MIPNLPKFNELSTVSPPSAKFSEIGQSPIAAADDNDAANCSGFEG